jgi:hypothetical protein
MVHLEADNDPTIAVDVELDLPPKPADAKLDNSTWRMQSVEYLTFRSGECFADAFKHSYKDYLFLAVRLPSQSIQGKPNELVYAVVLYGFFGFDGGILPEGEGFVAPSVSKKLPKFIKWSIDPSKRYVRSVGVRQAPVTGQYPDPSLNLLLRGRGPRDERINNPDW